MSQHQLFQLKKIMDHFAIDGELESLVPFGTGHINDSFVSKRCQAGTSIRYLHQRINDTVFKRPDEVMENILRVVTHIAEKLAQEGIQDASRRVLTIVPARTGTPWVRDTEGGWWRTYQFIEGAPSYDTPASAAQARVLGAAVGRFQKQLADLPSPRLHETIPAFHDMENRYAAFDAALEGDRVGRAAGVKAEIDFMLRNRERGAILCRALKEGRLPERICHNDAKMGNILVDATSGEGLCVVDLDTVMPGTVLYDFGDLVRTAASSAAEDERNLSKMTFNIDYFTALLDGYLSEASTFLVQSEIELLAEAGRTITQIMALRFLTDYLDGDRYYRIARPGHNLDRSRAQIALIESIDRVRPELDLIVARSL